MIAFGTFLTVAVARSILDFCTRAAEEGWPGALQFAKEASNGEAL